nr:hypothetical protein [Chloroflexota bacterium]
MTDAASDADIDFDPTGSEPPPTDARGVRAVLVQERIELVRGLVRRRPAGGALLGTRRGFSWLTAGGTAHVLMSTDKPVASILVTPDRAVVLTANIEADRIASEELDGIDLELEAFDWFADTGDRAVAQASVKGRLLGDADLEAELQPIRSVLAPLEQQRMRWLGARVQAALDQALESVEQGEPEDFLAADATMILGDAGIRAPVVLVAADDRIERFRHPLPGRATI